MSANKKILLLFLIFIVFLLHFPFLNADPDINISTSMGPFTDEGLYTSNVRNLIHQGSYDFELSDVPVKSPVFPFLFYIPFVLAGTKLIVARLTVLLLILTLYFFTVSKDKKLFLPAIPVLPAVFLQYHIFHFSHFAMSEALAYFLTIISVFTGNYFISKNSPLKAGVFPSLIIFFIILLKFNFIYLILLFPSVYFILWIIKKEKKYRTAFKYAILSTFIFIAIYFLFWVLPHKELFISVISSQTDNKFVSLKQLPGNIYILLNGVFFHKKLLPVTVFFVVSFIAFVFYRKKIKDSGIIIPSLIVWLILESHKLSMSYLPTRYFIGFIFPLLIFSVFFTVYAFKEINLFFKSVLIGLFTVIFFNNVSDYISSVKSRTYEISKINKEINSLNIQNKTAAGNWASTFCWDNNLRTIPIIDGEFNDTNVIGLYKPSFIAFVFDKNKIEHFNKNNHINLLKDSRKIEKHKIGRFTVGIFWLKTNKN